MKRIKILLILIMIMLMPLGVKADMKDQFSQEQLNPGGEDSNPGGEDSSNTEPEIEDEIIVEEEIKNDPNAQKITIDDVTMECVYENGYIVIYDGKNIYLSDNRSQSTNANTSVNVTNQYLLGGTDYLKYSVFQTSKYDMFTEVTTTTFKCPKYLHTAQVLNGGSTDEAKSYSNYFFVTDKPIVNASEATKFNNFSQYKYLEQYVLQVMKDTGWSSASGKSEKAGDAFLLYKSASGAHVYTECGYDNPNLEWQRNCIIKKLFAENVTFKNSLQLEDLIGVGYASNKGATTHTVTKGWWIFSSNSEEQATDFFGYKTPARGDNGEVTSESWATLSQLQRFTEKITTISETSELEREKIFVENERTPKFTCNYISEANQTISAKIYLSVEFYNNGMVLASGNNGTTSGVGLYSTLASATKYSSCPKEIYVKAPYQTINYNQENPTQTYNSVRYRAYGFEYDSGYVKMSKLANGTYVCKKVNGNYYDDKGNILSTLEDGTTAEQQFRSICMTGVDVCADYLPKTTQYLKQIINWLTILVPIFVGILIMIDFTKCIIANSNEFEDKHKRKLKHIKTRIFILILFLLLRPLINMVLGLLYKNGILQISNIDCLFF